MKTMSMEDNYEKNAFEKEIKELIRLVFEKAQEDSKETSKTGKSKHIENEINSQINQRTLVRYYNQFILGIDEKINHNKSGFDIIAKYLGFIDFADFCHQNFKGKNKAGGKDEVKIEKLGEKLENSIKPKYALRKVVYGLGITSVLGLGSYFGLNASNQPQCMYWKDNRYEAVHCDEVFNPNVSVIPLNEQLLDHFRKIEASDTTTFFRAGIPVIWYVKIDGEIEFYTTDGKHPINGKDLKPVTPYIIDKYIIANK